MKFQRKTHCLGLLIHNFAFENSSSTIFVSFTEDRTVPLIFLGSSHSVDGAEQVTESAAQVGGEASESCKEPF